jgi:hypothetical protein
MRCALGALLVVSVGLAARPASANGRYPNADMLVVDPGDEKHLVLRTTFGTLVSNDTGRDWSWICEEAVGYTGAEGDPAITVLSGGRLLHAFAGSVVISAQGACSFEAVPFEADGRAIVDATLDPMDTSHAWLIAVAIQAGSQASLIDATATTTSTRLLGQGFIPSTVEVARSRPQRLYVVGFDANIQATLLVSDDRGESWTPHAIGVYPASPMYLSAVDPGDPDTLYVRVDDGPADHLIVSRDGGVSFVDVLTIPSDMLGFALSPDGARVAAGGPGAGLFVANTRDLVFDRAADIESLRCLTWATSGLFACAQESLDHWTVALSTDEGASFQPLWHVQDLAPLECDPSTAAGAACPRAWLEIASRIGAELVPGDSSEPTPLPPATASKGSCAFGDVGGAPLGSMACGGLAATLMLRRRRR